MIPKIITQQLSALRHRERLLEAVWGLARLVALAVALVILACVVDYVVDRFTTTPVFVRLALWVAMLGVLLVAMIFFFQPLTARLGDDELTLWVEDKAPVLGHRLITAVQLNREHARIAGMSQELVGVVTGEAEQQVRRLPFTAAADHARLKRSALVAGPALLVGLGALLAFWPLSGVLLGRMFFSGEEIARRVTIDNLTAPVFAVGDPVTIRVKARGLRSDEEGLLLVRQGLAYTRYKLQREEEPGDSHNANEEAVLTARMPGNRLHGDFEFNAFAGDGRMKNWGQVVFKQRPVVQGDPQAWRILPAYCGTWGPYKQNRFQQPQPHGDVKSIKNSDVRVRVTMATPVVKARLKLLGPAIAEGEKGKKGEGEKGSEGEDLQDAFSPSPLLLFSPSSLVVKRVLEMKQIQTHEEEGQQWETTFDMRPGETAYEIVAIDENGFPNKPPPRRKLEIEVEKAPVVVLLPEQFPPKERQTPDDWQMLLKLTASDLRVEDVPLPVGQPICIAYTCNHPYGLGRARLMYRVQKKQVSGNDPTGNENFIPLRLGEGDAAALDMNDVQLASCGLLERSPYWFGNRDTGRDVKFFAMPTLIPADPSQLPELGRTLGGGWFRFSTKEKIAPDDQGQPFKVAPQKGDTIAYYVEVSPERTPGTHPRPVGKSEIRYKSVVSGDELEQFIHAWVNQEMAIRGLLRQQGNVIRIGDD